MQKIPKKYYITACVVVFFIAMVVLIISVINLPKGENEKSASESSSAAKVSSNDTIVSSTQYENSENSKVVTSSDTSSLTTSSKNKNSSNSTANPSKPLTNSSPNTLKKADAQTTAENLISTYYKYSFLGVCCEANYVNKDMSEFLNSSQQENYYGIQYKITCCHTANEVKAHILKFLDKSLITHNTEENLFFDNENNLYVMVMPFGINGYDSVELVEYSSNKIIAATNICDEYGELVARNTFTIEKESKNFIIKKIKRENYLI